MQKIITNNIRIKNCNNTTVKEITNISKNYGYTRSDFLNFKIKSMLEKFPDDIRKGIRKKEEKNFEQIVVCVSDKTLQELKNISEYLNIDFSNLIKFELFFVTEITEARLKKPPLDY